MPKKTAPHRVVTIEMSGPSPLGQTWLADRLVEALPQWFMGREIEFSVFDAERVTVIELSPAKEPNIAQFRRLRD